MKRNALLVFLAMVGIGLVATNSAFAQGTMFIEADKVGVHTATPAQEFHLHDGPDPNANGAFRISTANQAWDFATIDSHGAFRISKLGTGGSEFDLSPAGNLTISGEIFTSGSCGSGCDRVFSSGYELKSIEEHAARMWAEGNLPAVGPTAEEGPFNLSAKTLGMLNELEMAHIYIEQLNNKIQQKEARLSELQEENRKILSRLQRIEKRLAPPAADP